MADPKGFLTVRDREAPRRRPVPVRIQDWREIYEPRDDAVLRRQASRCMDCGIPFCHNGCPLGNLIPEWNDLTRRADDREAIEQLRSLPDSKERALGLAARGNAPPCRPAKACHDHGLADIGAGTHEHDGLRHAGRLGQNSTPACALTPSRKGCFTMVISVTRSAISSNSSLALRPVTMTCLSSGLSRRTSSTSSSGR